MQKSALKPTVNQTFEICSEGGDVFAAALEHSYALQQAGHIEEACNERYHAFQNIAELIPDDEEIVLEWEHPNTQAAIETIYASAVDHFLAGDMELSTAMFEMLLDLDPEDHTGAVRLLAFCYVETGEYELLDEIINDISDKEPDKHILLMWSAFRQEGNIPVGELQLMSRRFGDYLREFTAEEHPADENYLQAVAAEHPSAAVMARQLWLQTECLWSHHPDFITALQRAL